MLIRQQSRKHPVGPILRSPMPSQWQVSLPPQIHCRQSNGGISELTFPEHTFISRRRIGRVTVPNVLGGTPGQMSHVSVAAWGDPVWVAPNPMADFRRLAHQGAGIVQIPRPCVAATSVPLGSRVSWSTTTFGRLVPSLLHVAPLFSDVSTPISDATTSLPFS
jgi:hypothetical protein